MILLFALPFWQQSGKTFVKIQNVQKKTKNKKRQTTNLSRIFCTISWFKLFQLPLLLSLSLSLSHTHTHSHSVYLSIYLSDPLSLFFFSASLLSLSLSHVVFFSLSHHYLSSPYSLFLFASLPISLSFLFLPTVFFFCVPPLFSVFPICLHLYPPSITLSLLSISLLSPFPLPRSPYFFLPGFSSIFLWLFLSVSIHSLPSSTSVCVHPLPFPKIFLNFYSLSSSSSFSLSLILFSLSLPLSFSLPLSLSLTSSFSLSSSSSLSLHLSLSLSLPLTLSLPLSFSSSFSLASSFSVVALFLPPPSAFCRSPSHFLLKSLGLFSPFILCYSLSLSLSLSLIHSLTYTHFFHFNLIIISFFLLFFFLFMWSVKSMEKRWKWNHIFFIILWLFF